MDKVADVYVSGPIAAAADVLPHRGTSQCMTIIAHNCAFSTLTKCKVSSVILLPWIRSDRRKT